MRSSFTSVPAIEAGLAAEIRSTSLLNPVLECRWRTRGDMVLHAQEFLLWLDAARQEVRFNDTVVPQPSLSEHTLTQRYFLF